MLQIFVPYAKPQKTARCLDNKRLNKQILECIQIISANTRIDVGWKIPKYIYNHPCTKLWENDNFYLSEYLAELFFEYHIRNNFTRFHKGFEINKKFFILPVKYNLKHLTPEFCKKHQQILLDKDYRHYSKYFKVN